MLDGVAACAAAVRGRAVSALEVTRACLEAIETGDRAVQAFTAVDAERAEADARAVDEAIARGHDPGPLGGVPVAVKDLFDVAGLPTSYGSPAFEPYLPRTDSAAVRRLRAAGAIVVGKTRTSEFAWLGDTPPTENPLAPGLVPGGSSGGSGAAVAAGLVPCALGTDTGGSIRFPAAMCGVVGLKPTYGAVSLEGVLPCSWSLDHAGPLARSVEDARLVTAALVDDPALARPARLELRGARIGRLLPAAFADDGARVAFEDAAAQIAEDATVVDVDLPEARYAHAVVTTVSLVEGKAFMRRVGERMRLAHPEVREQLELAELLPGVLLVRAHQARRRIARAVAELFAEHRLDALVLPALITAPPRRGDEERRELPDGSRGRALDWSGRAFSLANVTGQPAVVVPSAGAGSGVQLVGRPHGEGRLLDLAAGALERFQDATRIDTKSRSHLNSPGWNDPKD
jgi:aspartyl-tRNA(Asn)/glutamyl-tRNA(Gln) amidotransferase subunit A